MEGEEDIQNILIQFSELSRRIANFEFIKAENIDLKLKIEEQKKLIQSLTEELTSIKISLNEVKNYQERLNNYSREKIENLENSISYINSYKSEISNTINSHSSELINLNSYFSILSKKVEDNYKEVLRIDKLESKISLYSLQDSDKRLETNSYITKVHSDILTLKEEISKKILSLESISFKLGKDFVLFIEEYKENETETKERFSCIKKERDDQDKIIFSKIDEMVIPDISNFITKRDIDDLKREFNLCSLDSKNSVSKCNNLESQISIMSKKIEGIQISLKSFELLGEQ